MQQPTETSVHNKEDQLHLLPDPPVVVLGLVTVDTTDSLQLEVSGLDVAADNSKDSAPVNAAVTGTYEDYRH